MISQKQIKEQITELSTLQDISQAYAEIASLRMKKTREFVLKSREFLKSIDEIFQEVRRSYRGTKNRITFLSHNGKTVAVFLSANTGLYGNIVRETFDLFKKEIQKTDSEVTIIGRLGRSFFLADFPTHPYTYFDSIDTKVDRESLIDIVTHLVQYEEIHVYYGKFFSVISQKPDSLIIRAETPQAQDVKNDKAQISKYIFEPSIEKILAFFETEMFTSVFEQALHESQLAKYASRMMAMDQAYENVGKNLKTINLKRQQVAHAIMNRKQLGLLSGMHLWKI